MEIKHIAGKNKGPILIYALSTCIWCRKTKKFLEQLGVGYDYVDVDLLDKNEKDNIMKEVEKWNPACSFPTVVINKKTCIVGYNEAKIRAELGE
ncbi:MAG TPA: glutaredoxin family protein [bacterium]